MIWLLALSVLINVFLTVIYVLTCVAAVQYRKQRDRLCHLLQRHGWLAAFEGERTIFTRDPERRD